MRLSRVLRISRPRFWIYELGPYMIGVLGGIYGSMLIKPHSFFANQTPHYFGDNILIIVCFAIYFLIPANIWIYGINDIYDYETDKLNPKKIEGYEALVQPQEQKTLRKRIVGTTIPFIILLVLRNAPLYQINTFSGQMQTGPFGDTTHITTSYAKSVGLQFGFEYPSVLALIAFLAFLFFSGQYSAKPIRAKARPILDSFFSAGHYITTAIFGYLLVNPTGDINRYYVIAGMARAMAMHAFSAVPDIQADKDAKLATIATLLGGKATIWACFGLYLLASLLSYSFLGRVSIVLGVAYCGLMIGAAILYGNEKKLFALYKRFPWINTVSGMILFFVVLLKII